MNNTPAFPTSNWQKITPMASGYNEGMTLRDYFAAKAMQALLTNPECPLVPLDEVPQASYKMADGMMKEREA